MGSADKIIALPGFGAIGGSTVALGACLAHTGDVRSQGSKFEIETLQA